MKLGPTLAWSAAALCALAPIAHAQDGSVRIPLSQYEALTTGGGREESAAGYAFSQARVTAVVSEEGEQAVAEVTVEASVEVLTDEWTLVPIASTGAAVTSVTEGGASSASRPAAARWCGRPKRAASTTCAGPTARTRAASATGACCRSGRRRRYRN